MSTAQVIKAAYSQHEFSKTRLLTVLANYPRIIHAELLTHKMLSKNSSSSRAIPSNSVIEQLEQSLFVPEYWGMNQSGMQAKQELDAEAAAIAYDIWIDCGRNLIEVTRKLGELKLHKQLANRVSECFQMIKVCISGTEWNNFLWLRDHGDAQPEIQDVARGADYIIENEQPRILRPGDWHLPFYQDGYWTPDGETDMGYIDIHGFTLIQAQKISASCCAQTSYRKNDASLEKAEKLFDMFFDADRVHASPAEHQGTPLELTNVNWNLCNFNYDSLFAQGNAGATHVDKFGDVWSANFKHWSQFRQHLEGHVKRG